jgi:magnesium transporter
MVDEALVEEIRRLLDDKRWADARQRVATWAPAEIADLLEALDKSRRVLLFRALGRDRSAEVFSYVEGERQDELLATLTDQETRDLLAGLTPDDRTSLLEELPGEVTRRLLRLLSPEDLSEARRLLGYPEESVGRLMTPDYVSVRPQWTVRQALAHVRERGRDSETVNLLYVTDEAGVLIDDIRLRRIILADPDATVADLMDRHFVSLSAFDDREVAVRKMKEYDVVALPVVDTRGVLLGIVTVDDVLDVAEEEATEDIHKSASVAPLRTSYREAPVKLLYQRRVAWLLLLVVVSLSSSGVIAAFEQTLESAIVLAFFIPLLIATGGNTGAQSSTLVLRALSTNDLQLGAWGRTLLKEMGVGILLGFTVGLLAWGLGHYRGGIEIGLVVGVTMLAIIVVANLVGMTLPFVLARFGQDPAVASSPLITTVMDTLGLLIYFTVAHVVLFQ